MYKNITELNKGWSCIYV